MMRAMRRKSLRKWQNFFDSESDQITVGISEEDTIITNNETVRSGYHHPQLQPAEQSNLENKTSFSGDGDERFDDVFTENDSSNVQEETDEESTDAKKDEVATTSQPITQQNTISELDIDFALSEAKARHKHDISKSKRRRLQRLRRKYATETMNKEDYQHESETVCNVDKPLMSSKLQQGDKAIEVQPEDASPTSQINKKKNQLEHQISASTDSSVDTGSKCSDEQRDCNISRQEMSAAENFSGFADSEGESRTRKMHKKKKRKHGDERIISPCTADSMTSAPEVVIEMYDNSERNLSAQSRLDRDDRAELRDLSGQTAERVRTDDELVTLSQDELQAEQDEMLAQSVGKPIACPVQLRPSGPSRSRSRSKSPVPPNLRRITGQPQRRRPRKNIVVVSNPQQF
uniref:Uncharacterized protein n=1 Tax=Arion vulgaris TaxID=1028688 RepID=A0A0B7BGR6_9EUPU